YDRCRCFALRLRGIRQGSRRLSRRGGKAGGKQIRGSCARFQRRDRGREAFSGSGRQDFVEAEKSAARSGAPESGSARRRALSARPRRLAASPLVSPRHLRSRRIHGLRRRGDTGSKRGSGQRRRRPRPPAAGGSSGRAGACSQSVGGLPIVQAIADNRQMKSKKQNPAEEKKSVAQLTTPPKEKKPGAPRIKELLLSGPRFDLILPKRTKWRHRPPVEFD